MVVSAPSRASANALCREVICTSPFSPAEMWGYQLRFGSGFVCTSGSWLGAACCWRGGAGLAAAAAASGQPCLVQQVGIAVCRTRVVRATSKFEGVGWGTLHYPWRYGEVQLARSGEKNPTKQPKRPNTLSPPEMLVAFVDFCTFTNLLVIFSSNCSKSYTQKKGKSHGKAFK